MLNKKERYDIAHRLRKLVSNCMSGCLPQVLICRALGLQEDDRYYSSTMYVTGDSVMHLADVIEPVPWRICKVDRRDPANPICVACGQKWDDDWAFCPQCGREKVGYVD